MNIIKRNGEEQPFNPDKIKAAISKANDTVRQYEALSDTQIGRIVEFVTQACQTMEKTPTVEDVQDMVERHLMGTMAFEVAKHYILYRNAREKTRTNRQLTEKLFASNTQNQNANVDEHSFGGRKGEAASFIAKDYALNNVMTKKSVRNHLNNEIYVHDLDAYAIGCHNCLSVPFDKLLAEGFRIRQTDIRPAGSINTAFQLLAVIFQIQSLQQFGGVSATHLDWTMVPYVRMSFFKQYRKACEARGLTPPEIDRHKVSGISVEDTAVYTDAEAAKLAMQWTTEELGQAVEGMYHNLNSLQSRSGDQLPFTSINYGTCTLPEGRMVTKALLEGSLKGTGAFGRTPIFPCGIFQCMKGVNRKAGDPNYDLFRLALKSTAKRLYPNYANCDWTGNAGYDPENPCTYFSTMGCRTANGWDINCDDPKLGQLKDGRGNICPVTVILPTLAMQCRVRYEADGQYDEDKCVAAFMKLLDKKIGEARDMLLERFEHICSQSASSAKFMYENGTMYGYRKEEGIRSALKHGTLALGQLGLAEALQILIGCDHTCGKGMELAKRIEQLFKDRCAEFKKDNRLNFGVYYTPAENLCHTALKAFREKYGIIKDVSDRDYFTNSMHVPVWHKLTAFEKIDIEAQLTGYSSAGCITYVELDSDVQNNTQALEDLVNYAMDKDIPYFAINVPSDICLDCGYQGRIEDKCPECGSSNVEQLRRVTGYLTGDYKTAFNKGKQAEASDRVKHTGVEA